MSLLHEHHNTIYGYVNTSMQKIFLIGNLISFILKYYHIIVIIVNYFYKSIKIPQPLLHCNELPEHLAVLQSPLIACTCRCYQKVLKNKWVMFYDITLVFITIIKLAILWFQTVINHNNFILQSSCTVFHNVKIIIQTYNMRCKPKNCVVSYSLNEIFYHTHACIIINKIISYLFY